MSKYTFTDAMREGYQDFAQMVIDKDCILDSIPILLACDERCVKSHKTGDCITDGGALVYMRYLMQNCKQNQIRQVDYLIREFFPNMVPGWFFYPTLMKNWLRMHGRFGSGEYCIIEDKITRDVKSGKLPADFSTHGPI